MRRECITRTGQCSDITVGCRQVFLIPVVHRNHIGAQSRGIHPGKRNLMYTRMRDIGIPGKQIEHIGRIVSVTEYDRGIMHACPCRDFHRRSRSVIRFQLFGRQDGKAHGVDTRHGIYSIMFASEPHIHAFKIIGYSPTVMRRIGFQHIIKLLQHSTVTFGIATPGISVRYGKIDHCPRERSIVHNRIQVEL